MSIYNSWRFTDNPFSARPLGADSTGNRLFVGRDDELRKVGIRLASGGAAVCLDGPVGVGKTSLANIAAYRAEQKYRSDPDRSPLLVPCRQSFQVSSAESADEFKHRVLTEVAQTLLEKGPSLEMIGSKSINAWLNSPLLSQWSVGGTFSIGAGDQPNSSAGFTSSGFLKTVTGWLESIFPEDRAGGIVCVLDNLELLETSALARRKIEALRDTLFTIKGLRWILCGAHGILQGVVGSQRLVGHLQEPVAVKPLALAQSQEIFKARVRNFAIRDREPYLPLAEDDFHRVYLIVHSNLRNTLAYADEYCMHVAESGQEPETAVEKEARFEAWLKGRAKSISDAINIQVGPRALKLFQDSITKLDGAFSPSDFSTLGFQSLQAMRPQVKSLEEVGLLEAQRDDTDQRRKSIAVTGKGWLVNWHQVTQQS